MTPGKKIVLSSRSNRPDAVLNKIIVYLNLPVMDVSCKPVKKPDMNNPGLITGQAGTT